jgi:hypothetical protein
LQKNHRLTSTVHGHSLILPSVPPLASRPSASPAKDILMPAAPAGLACERPTGSPAPSLGHSLIALVVVAASQPPVC